MAKSSKEFQAAYKKLNPEQRTAVDTIEGPVMLVAGPGTGKTQTLALRIANILQKTDTLASSILALTYTESGARAMRTRLISMIGPEAYYANISTFHAFCIEVIKDNPGLFTLNPAVEPLSDLEKLKLIYRLIDTTPLTLLRPLGAPRLYVKEILGAISDLKREGIDPEEFEKLLEDEELFLKSDNVEELKKSELTKRIRNLAKNRELNLLYRKYQQALKDSDSFDFEDMISSVVDAFKNNDDLLFSCQEKYLYILVDEYQDSNSAQNELMLLLAKYWGDKANIFVTGDPDQSIMRFQGASIENQLSFIKVYPEATVITLKQNYRSTQNILDAANSLISHNNLRIGDVVPGVDPHLNSQIGPGDKINIAELSGSTAETIYIAEDIKTKINAGILPSEIAVIYHTNKEASLIADTLTKYNIDYSVQGGANVLSDPIVRNFLKILRVIFEMRNSQEDEDLFTILHYDIFEIDPLDVLKISRLAGDSRLNLFEVLTRPELLDGLALSSRGKIDVAFANLREWQSLDANKTFTEFFEEVLNKSGYLNWILDEGKEFKNQVVGAHHRLARLNTLFDEVKRMNRANHELDLKSFMENLKIMEDNNLRLEESNYGVNRDTVTLTTAHKSKGLEWGHIYIYKAIDKNWGNNEKKKLITLPDKVLKNVKLSDKEKNEDERRLFYVAITRAKTNLTICRSSTYSNYGKSQEASPTMFISELNDTLLTQVDVNHIEELAHKHIETILGRRKKENTTDDERAFLQESVAKFKLAATSLNAYLYCAYKFKLDKLLRVPHAKKSHLSFGTSVHKALEKFYLKYKDEGTTPSKEYLLSHFRASLKSSVITKGDLSVYMKKGEDVLSSYYDLNVSNLSIPLEAEKKLSTHFGDIEITGMIDRLEWADKEARLVRVVDYKTGKSKTLGQIEGTTQDSDGELKRQLEFYKLLIDSNPSLNYKFGEGMLDFVEEPLEKGKDGKRRFQVTDSQLDDLRKTITQAMDSIRALQFPRTTDYKKCEKCYFIDHCYPKGLPIGS